MLDESRGSHGGDVESLTNADGLEWRESIGGESVAERIDGVIEDEEGEASSEHGGDEERAGGDGEMGAEGTVHG